MRTQLSKLVFTVALVLALAFTFGCSSDKDEGSNEQSYKYCIKDNICLEGPFTSSTCTGQLSNSCPNAPNLGSSSSSRGNSSSSSSTMPSSSSVASSSAPSSSSSRPSSSSSSLPSSSSNSTQANIVYGADVTYQGETYKTVKIGSQTWFQRNLNYAVEGSKCGNGEVLSDANTAACDTYGRLYNWATAMALPSKCNSKLSTSDADCAITTLHKGICPTGWHIPSDAEWTALETAVGGEETAGKYLKARNGWNENGNGTDDFGFSALPGGSGYSDGSFYYVGNYGTWWSASEVVAYLAYYRNMGYGNEDVGRSTVHKFNLQSVRCLQD